MPKEDFRFNCVLRVRWAECDVQGIVFNAAYVNYVEIGQSEYFRNLGIAIYDSNGRRHFDLATVRVGVDFLSPARMDDVLQIHWKVESIGNSSLTTNSEIYNSRSGDLLSRAEVIYVSYDNEAEAATPVPDDMRRLIQTYEETGEVLPLDALPGLAGLTRALPEE